MLVWQAPLPTDTVAKQIQSFVDQGRTVVFLPPSDPDATKFGGVSWGEWQRAKGSGATIGYWNNDADLLAKTRNGQSLPVNDLLVYRHCKLEGEFRVLAKLENEAPLLTRLSSNAGAMYFLSTWPTASHSSLDREGITLFAMTHRAISGGAESLGAAKQFEAGSLPARAVESMPVMAPAVTEKLPVLAQARPFRAGVYGTESQLIALNRPLSEDRTSPISVVEMNSLFDGLDFQIVDDTLGSGQSLASEIWKIFLALMGIALIAEALLCMPPKAQPQTALVTEPVAGRAAA